MLCCCAATAAACRCRGCKRSMRRRGNLYSLFSKVLNVMLNLFEMLLHIGHIFSNPWDSLVYKGASFKEQDFEKFSDFGFRTLKIFRFFPDFGSKFFQSPQNLPPLGLPCLQGSPKGRDFEKFSDFGFRTLKNFRQFPDSGAKIFQSPRNPARKFFKVPSICHL